MRSDAHNQKAATQHTAGVRGCGSVAACRLPCWTHLQHNVLAALFGTEDVEGGGLKAAGNDAVANLNLE